MRTVRLLALLLCTLALTSLAALPRRIPLSDAASSSASSHPTSLTLAGSQVFFTATDVTHGFELWRSDGTAAGTRLVKDIRPGTESSHPSIIGAIGDAVIFTAVDTEGRWFWRSNGTVAGTIRLGSLPQYLDGTSYYYVETEAADTRAYVFTRGGYGDLWELHVTDGSLGGTRRVGVYPLSNASLMLGVNGKLYFVGSDATVGVQLWVTDGTPTGTHIVRKPVECPGPLCGPVPQRLFRAGTQAFFLTEKALWKTDGTAAGTMQLALMENAQFVVSTDTTAFLVVGDTLWKTDGTVAGTQAIEDVDVSRAIGVLSDGRVAFFANDGPNSVSELWTSNGTPAGTMKVADVPPRGGDVVGLLGSRVLFPAYDAAIGTELWSANVDTGASALVLDIDPRHRNGALSGSPRRGVTLGSKVLFAATDFYGMELWESDGTTNGTKLLANIAGEAAAGALSGTVTDAATNLPIENALIVICPQSGCEETTTDANGHYRFPGVIAGTFWAYAYTTAHPFQSWGVTGEVTVEAGMETSGVDFSLVRGARISGTVKRASTGDPVFAEVFIYNSDGIVVSRALSYPGDTGFLTWALLPGTYYAEARPIDSPVIRQLFRNVNCEGECNLALGEPIVLTSGNNVTGIDFSLRDYGTIAGTIRDASNNEVLRSATVEFTRPGDQYSGIQSLTNESGNYVSPPLYPGTWNVTAWADGFKIKTHPSTVTVTMDGAVTGIDLSLTPNRARITGIIRDSTNAPLSGVWVALYHTEGYYGGYFAETDSSGRYAINDVTPATYLFHFVDELYPNVNCPWSECNPAGATAFPLINGQTFTLDAKSKSRRTTVSGRVTDAPSGQPLDGASVDIRNTSGHSLTSARADSSGNYTVSVVSRLTSFRVAASAYDHHTKTSASLAPGTHTNVDFALLREGSISGTVFNALTGQPMKDVGIAFRRSSDGAYGNTYTDDDGRYFWTGAPGSYYVYADAHSDYQGQVYPDLNCAGVCDPTVGTLVTLTDGVDRANVDFHLNSKAGKITGRVVDDLTGAGVANVYVQAVGADESYSDWTDADGYYEIDGYYWSQLESGDYRMYAVGPNPYWTQVYGGPHCVDSNACNLDGGAIVQVNAPNTTTGIDFRLVRSRITAITPAQGPVIGGTRIAILGVNFTPGATVQIGGNEAIIESRTGTQIVAITPPGVVGAAHVKVMLAPALSVTMAHGLLYTFSDEPLMRGASVLKAIHITELRDAINALRASASLAPFVFSDASLSGRHVRGAHILELRTALDQARAALGRTALIYRNPATGVIRAEDVTELRDGLR